MTTECQKQGQTDKGDASGCGNDVWEELDRILQDEDLASSNENRSHDANSNHVSLVEETHIVDKTRIPLGLLPADRPNAVPSPTDQDCHSKDTTWVDTTPTYGTAASSEVIMHSTLNTGSSQVTKRKKFIIVDNENSRSVGDKSPSSMQAVQSPRPASSVRHSSMDTESGGGQSPNSENWRSVSAPASSPSPSVHPFCRPCDAVDDPEGLIEWAVDANPDQLNKSDLKIAMTALQQRVRHLERLCATSPKSAQTATAACNGRHDLMP